MDLPSRISNQNLVTLTENLSKQPFIPAIVPQKQLCFMTTVTYVSLMMRIEA
jgi:hypothetical protein